MPTSEQLFEAGAFLPPNTKLKRDDHADDISARTYTHPALGDQPVVRLTPDNLAAGDDLTMDFLGFEAPQVIGPVAKQRRRALGFPGWALVNDPKHAKFALEVVKDFKKHSRKAKSKPGHANDGFLEIAAQLGKSVAHFLPSFWEQVGREYIELGNSTYASRAFSKAREAENVHGLKVDEKLRQDAFLEFALSGCVSAKVLTEYGKELQTAHKPKEAWDFFRDLCVRRTLGGLAPWTSMIKDVQSLVKAAKLDVEEEIHKLLTEMIDSPALSRASQGFWKGASKFIKTLVKKDDHVAGALLNLIPQTSSWERDDIWWWLDFLEEWKILENAWAEGVSTEAGPEGGPASWVSRVLQIPSRPRQKVFDILDAMAERLKKDGQPVVPYQKPRWGDRREAEIDVLETLLEQGVPIADAPKGLELSLRNWANVQDEGEPPVDRPKDPLLVAQDDRFRERMFESLDHVFGDAAFQAAAAGKEALAEARREWLLKLIAKAGEKALPDAEDALTGLDSSTTAELFGEFPDAYEELKKVDLLPAITRTLQGGIMDEYGWPKLEEVFDQMVAKGNKPQAFGSFPYAIVTDGLNATVIKGDEIVHEAEIKLDKGAELRKLDYLDGDLLVKAGERYQCKMYWNSKPKDKVDTWFYSESGLSGIAIDLPEGGTVVGRTVFHSGDTKNIDRSYGELTYDGEHFWHLDWNSDHSEQYMVEFDPATGKDGRKSWPSFYEDFMNEETEFDVRNSDIFYVGDVVNGSPLGSKDGLVGHRLRQYKNNENKRDFEGIDGRSLTSDKPFFLCAGLLDRAGAAGFFPLCARYRETEIWDPDLNYPVTKLGQGVGAYNRGFVCGLPAHYWHFLRVRDEATSKKLRTISQKDVQSLIDAGCTDFDEAKKKVFTEAEDFPTLDAAIKKLLPKLKHERFFAGLRSVVIQAVRQVRKLERLIKERDPSKIKVTKIAQGADASVPPVMGMVLRYAPHIPGELQIFSCLGEVYEFLSGQVEQIQIPDRMENLLQFFFKDFDRKAWLAYWTKDQSSDDHWLTFLKACSELELFNLRGKIRVYSAEVDKSVPFLTDDEMENLRDVIFCYVQNDSRFLISKSWRYFTFFEYTEADKFETIEGVDTKRLDMSDLEILTPNWNQEQIQKFAKLAESNEQVYPDQDFMQALADDMGLSLGEVVLIWFGYPKLDSYESNFMPKHLREQYKLKVKEANAARESLNALDESLRGELLSALLDGDPAEYWESPPTKMADRLKAAWKKHKPNRLELPLDMLETLSDAFAYSLDNTEILVALNEPEKNPIFNTKRKWKPDFEDRLEFVADGTDPEFNSEVLEGCAMAIAFLAYNLPVGDPSRKQMANVYDATLKVLDNPELILNVEPSYFYDEKDQDAALKTLKNVIKKTKKLKGADFGEEGAFIAGIQYRHTLIRGVRPAKLKKPADYEKFEKQIQATDFGGNAPIKALQIVKLMRSPEMKSLIQRLKKTSVPDGQYEANPLLSAPTLVEEVAKKLGVSENAAVYYLQILALHDPTDKNVQRWNDWKSVAIKKATKELIDGDHLVEAKRSRAGRKVFLPGAWEALKAPHLPLETWKMPLFHLVRDEYNRAAPPLPRILPLEPVHELFSRAWQRVLDGDEPKYEEV